MVKHIDTLYRLKDGEGTYEYEAVKHLPVVSEKYYESLVRLGIVEPVAAAPEAAAKSGKVTADDDALDELMHRTNGRGTGAR